MINNKEAKAIVLYSAVVFGLLIFILSVYLAFAAPIITTVGGATTTSFNVNEDVQFVYNISVNNTDVGQNANITRVNIIFPESTFAFITNSNYSNAPSTFSNTSTILSWINTSGFLINGSSTAKYFWFNATVSDPGNYNLTIMTINATGSYYSNISVIVNDTTSPRVAFVAPIAGGNYSGNLVINASVNDSYTSTNSLTSAVYFNITNSSGAVVNITIASQQGSGIYWSGTLVTTGLLDGIYNVTAYANDSANNINSSVRVTQIRIDNTYPSILSGILATSTGNYTRNWTYVDVNASDSDSGIQNLTVYFYNISGTTATLITTLNVSFGGSDNNLTYNFTGLTNGKYFWNATVNDRAGNINSTFTTKQIILDSTGPAVSFVKPVVGGNYSGNLVINASVNDSLLATGTVYFNITNSTGKQINITAASRQGNGTYWNGTLATTGFDDGLYNVTAYTNDSLGNSNNSVRAQFRIDNTAPVLSLLSPIDGVSSTGSAYNFTFNASSEGSVANCTLLLNEVPSNFISTVRVGENGMYNSSIAVGSYTWRINCTETAGNLGNTSTRSFTVAAATEATGGGGADAAQYWKSNYVPSDSELSTGYTKEIGVQERVTIRVNNVNHLVGVTGLTATSVTINISSITQQAALSIGETKKFDVESDGYYDVQVTLNGIVNNKASLTVKTIHEQVSTAAGTTTTQTGAGTETTSTSEGTTTTQTGSQTGTQAENESSSNWYLWVILVIVVAVLIWLIMHARTKRRKHSGR